MAGVPDQVAEVDLVVDLHSPTAQVSATKAQFAVVVQRAVVVVVVEVPKTAVVVDLAILEVEMATKEGC